MNTEIIDLFPTSVMVFNIGRPYTEKELLVFEKIGNNLLPNRQNKVSNSSKLLNKYPELFDIKNFIEDSIKKYINDVIKPKFDLELEITLSWSQFTSEGQSHERHCHANSILSGVLYIQTKETDRIIFYKQNTNLIIDSKDPNIRNSCKYWMPCNVGKLIIFPSDLMHSVDKVYYDGLRISLAFNTWIKGEKGLNLINVI